MKQEEIRSASSAVVQTRKRLKKEIKKLKEDENGKKGVFVVFLFRNDFTKDVYLDMTILPPMTSTEETKETDVIITLKEQPLITLRHVYSCSYVKSLLNRLVRGNFSVETFQHSYYHCEFIRTEIGNLQFVLLPKGAEDGFVDYCINVYNEFYTSMKKEIKNLTGVIPVHSSTFIDLAEGEK